MSSSQQSSSAAKNEASGSIYAETFRDKTDGLHTKSMYFVLFAGMLVVVLILSKKLHERPIFSSFISEASLVLMIGMLVGAGICIFLPEVEEQNDTNEQENEGEEGSTGEYDPYVLAHSLLSFSPNVFFMALLPPIIFNSGYQLRRELFYRHIGPILRFACLGTTISACSTGFALYAIREAGWMRGSAPDPFTPTLMEFLTFGALIAATDTVSVLSVFQAKKVDPHLFYLVFGESALNDAVALVLFNTFADLLKTEFAGARSVLVCLPRFGLKLAAEAIGSPTLGMLIGWLAAYLFKCVDFRQQKHLELPLYLLLMYVPFVAAECLYVSGIVAIFFAGISARRYIVPNVTEDTKKNAQTIFKVAAFLAETFIFLELGLSVFGLPGSFNWAFIGWAFVASLMGRAVGTYPVAFLYNFGLKERTVHPDCDTTNVKVGIDDGLIRVNSFDSAASNNSSGRRRRKTPKKRKDKQITLRMTHVIWFAGLRGAVAYACVRSFPNVYGHADEFTAATMVIVLVSIIVMGGATESLLHCLGIEMGVDEDEYMQEWHRQRALTGWFHDFESEYAYQMVVREPKSPASDDHSVGSTLGGFFDYQHSDEPPEFIAEKNTPPEAP